MKPFVLTLLLLSILGCSEAREPECQAGWKRCNGASVEVCNRSTFRWQQAQNCVETGYDDCAEVTVRYAAGNPEPPLCQGDEEEYSTCATEDTRRDVWIKDWICVDRGLPGQG